MKIGINNYQSNAISQYQNKQLQSSKEKATEVKSNKKDTLEISKEAYSKQKETTTEMRASSGKDLLGISKGKDENTFVVDFEHLAFASRAVSRGYITVNGTEVKLSDEVKEKLMQVAEEADKIGEAEQYARIAKFNKDVAAQQAAAWKHAFDLPDSLKLILGIKDSPADKAEIELSRKEVSMYDYEWTGYHPTMEISIQNGEATIGDIGIKEITIQEGK